MVGQSESICSLKWPTSCPQFMFCTAKGLCSVVTAKAAKKEGGGHALGGANKKSTTTVYIPKTRNFNGIYNFKLL